MSRCLILLASVLLIAGCSCDRYTYGYVADYNSHEPLVGAQVYSFAALDEEVRDERVVKTDTKGWFETAFALKSIAKCGNLKLIIDYPGYAREYRIDLPPGDTIFMRKITQ